MEEKISASVAQKTLDLVAYLNEPEASRCALRHVKYFKQHPLDQWITYFESDEDQLLSRGRIHVAISTKENELKLARRLNLITLWEALITCGGSNDMNIRIAKVSFLFQSLTLAKNETNRRFKYDGENVGTHFLRRRTLA